MNSKSKLMVKYDKGVIEMNTTFTKMMQNPLSDEYALLQKIRTENPSFAVRRRQIKTNPNKECWKGLTYEYMENYIDTHEEGETRIAVLKEFAELRLIAECHSKCHRYPTIKKWFLAKYHEIAEFGMGMIAEDAQAEDANELIPFPASQDEADKIGA